MALFLTSGPYSDPNGIDVAFWVDMAQNWLSPGVIKGKLNEFLVFADSSGRQVKVRDGWAWVESQFVKHTGDNYVLPIVANSSGVTRFDYVILRNDLVAEIASLTTKEGSAGVPPTLQQDASAYEIMLALVTVANGAVTLAAGTVADMRAFSAPGPVRYHAKGVTSNPATVGTSALFLTDMSLALTTRGGDIDVSFFAAGSHSIAAATALFWVQLDAGALVDISGFSAAVANIVEFFGGKHRFTGVSAGRHTIAIYFQTASGTLTMRATNRTLTVEEVW